MQAVWSKDIKKREKKLHFIGVYLKIYCEMERRGI